MTSMSLYRRARLHSPLSILAGLLCAQIIAAAFVWQSNTALYQKTQALTAAGWFVVPTASVAGTLLDIGPALKGALFYTLSIGAGLTLLTWTVLWLQRRFFTENRWFLRSSLIFWALLLIAVNSNGPVLYATLFVALIPAAAALPWLPVLGSADVSGNRLWALPACVLLLLTGIWSTQLNSDLFINIRDHVLLSNPLGRRINDFYYRNTLYAAESFRSFQQKAIRSCRMENIPAGPARDRLQKALTFRDILAVSPEAPTDLLVSTAGGDRWRFHSRHGSGVTVEPGVFLKNPADTLKRFDRSTDRYRPLRLIIFFGLLIGFPCLLYVGIYACLRKTADLFFPADRATLAAGTLCLVFGLGLFASMLIGHPGNIPQSELNTVLENGGWPERVAALHQIEDKKLEIADFPAYRKILDSPLVVERYWLAHALGDSRSQATYRDLLTLAEDTHPNVVCQALQALGDRRQRGAIDIIRKTIAASNNWYVQGYGYSAMRRLGWRQSH